MMGGANKNHTKLQGEGILTEDWKTRTIDDSKRSKSSADRHLFVLAMTYNKVEDLLHAPELRMTPESSVRAAYWSLLSRGFLATNVSGDVWRVAGVNF